MQPEKKSKRLGGMILRLIGTLLTLILLVYLLSQQGWQEIGEALMHMSLWHLGLALGFMLLSRFAVAGRWYTLLRFAHPRLSLMQSIQLTFAGLFASNFLPTTIGGDVVRLAGAIKLKLDPAISAASLAVDRLVGMAGMLMVAPLGLPSLFAANQAKVSFHEDRWISSLGITLWGQRILDAFTRLTKRFLDAITIWRHHPLVLLESLLFSWLHMICFFGVQWLILSGLGENISYWTVAGLYSLVYFVILLPFSINGYGLQEVSITFVFSNFGGVSMQNSLTLALLFRTIVMIASLPGAFFVPGLLQNRDTDNLLSN